MSRCLPLSNLCQPGDEPIDPEALLAVLDGLPEDSTHCATLAVNTLRQAMAEGQRQTRGER